MNGNLKGSVFVPEIIHGKSAYEIAVIHGFDGTEEEWLASLKGADGADGEKGEKGEPGEKGADGKDGVDGKDGADGKDADLTGYVKTEDLTDYVKNTDYAESTKGGVVKVSFGNSAAPIYRDGSGSLHLGNANTTINAKNTENAIRNKDLDHAVKVGISTNTQSMTAEEKKNALAWLGVNEALARRDEQIKGLYENVYGNIPEPFITDEATAFEIVVPNDVLPYAEITSIDASSVHRVKHDGNLVSFEDATANGLTLVNNGDGIITISGTATGEVRFTAPFMFSGGTTYYFALEFVSGQIPSAETQSSSYLMVPTFSPDYMFELADRIRRIGIVECEAGDYGENPEGSLQLCFPANEKINLTIRPVVNTELEDITGCPVTSVESYSSDYELIDSCSVGECIAVESFGYIRFMNDAGAPFTATITYMARG